MAALPPMVDPTPPEAREPAPALPDEADVIGGFQYRSPLCGGCGKPLTVENAWMTDGCPCNSALGVNSMNETRWRLLMQLQQQQARKLEQCRAPSFSELAARKTEAQENVHRAIQAMQAVQDAIVLF